MRKHEDFCSQTASSPGPHGLHSTTTLILAACMSLALWTPYLERCRQSDGTCFGLRRELLHAQDGDCRWSMGPMYNMQNLEFLSHFFIQVRCSCWRCRGA